MNRKDVPLPEYMKDLRIDPRGFPIPFVIYIDKNNEPHFKINDSEKIEQCLLKKLCNICGKPLGKDMWFIGGQLSAFHPKGAFNDSPVHHSCGRYALQICPYMAFTQYRKTNWHDTDSLKGLALVDPTQTLVRLSFFAFVKTNGYKINCRGRERYLLPIKPYLDIEYWLDGKQIHQAEVNEILKKKGEHNHTPTKSNY